MSHPDYRPAQRRRARQLMLGFEFVNTLSFVLLAGNLITLLMLRLGAGPTLIGIMAAFPYVAFFFMPFAKGAVARHGLVRTFGTAWTARYLVVIPIVLAPLLVIWDLRSLGVGLVMGAYFLFQVMRGFGLVSISPLNNEISAGKDRGEFLSRKMMFTYTASILAGILVSLSLGPEAPLERYSLFMGAGIVLGLVGCGLIFRIPEPPSAGFGAKGSLLADLRRGWADPAFRLFLLAVAAVYFVSALWRPFLIVYAKQVCRFGDDAAMVLTVVGNLGAIAMGWLCRLVMDRMGAKPLLVIFALLSVLVCLPLAVVAPLGGALAWIMLSLVFFLSTFAAAGTDNAGQAWLFVKAEPGQQFNYGMIYYFVLGLAGALGSFLGGVLLDASSLAAAPFEGWLGRGAATLGFNAFFVLACLLGVPVALLLARLAPLGAKPVADTLSTIFSLRDLQTIITLRRMDSPSGIVDEERALARIRESDSELAVEEVLKRLASPLYSIRNQALLSLERLPMTTETEDALIDQVRHHQFASAYRAARILGQKGVARAVPVLRAALDSEDYFLQAWAAGALGDLVDQDSRPALERLVRTTEHTLVLIHCIGALKQLARPESYPAVMAVLARREVPAHLRDEVVFGLAGIAGVADWLYPKYLAFLENSGRGAAHLLDELDAARAAAGGPPGVPTGLAADLERLVGLVDTGGSDYAALAETVLVRLEDAKALAAPIAAETRVALANQSIGQFIRFRFFVAALAVYAFRDLSINMSR
jgi:HEAT repeat protein/predicted MFS family arabinose efflux permease